MSCHSEDNSEYKMWQLQQQWQKNLPEVLSNTMSDISWYESLCDLDESTQQEMKRLSHAMGKGSVLALLQYRINVLSKLGQLEGEMMEF